MLVFSSLFPSRARPRHGIFVETRLRHLLREAAFDVRVIAPVPWFPLRHATFGEYARFAATPRHETRDGLQVSYPRYAMVPRLGVGFQPDSVALAARVEIARLDAEGWRPDLIDAHFLYPDGVAAAMLAERLGCPFVMTARGSDVNVIARLPGPARRIAWAAERAAAIVAVAPQLKVALVASGVPASKISVLRNGVDTELFRPEDRMEARARLGLPQGPLLACVGNLLPVKGQALAVEALIHLPEHRLLLVGEGPLRNELEALGRRLGVAERLLFRASMAQEELRQVYSGVNALLLTSEREGWPNVVLESLACGTPVVATNVGAVPDMINQPGVGRVVATRNAAAVAAAVRETSASRAAPACIRAHAARYDWASVARAQAALYVDVTARARAHGGLRC